MTPPWALDDAQADFHLACFLAVLFSDRWWPRLLRPVDPMAARMAREGL